MEEAEAQAGAGSPFDGTFRLLDEIGRGSRGVVFHALQQPLEEPVAIKVLHERLGEDAPGREQFNEEVRAFAGLDHPNLVAISSFGIAGEAPYIVMELLEGETLSARLARGPVDSLEAESLIQTLLRAVAHLHLRGLVHRNLSPAAMFLQRKDGRDQLKLIDYGLSHFAENTEARRLALGSPYLSPEQVGGDDSDARADVYAAGAIMRRLFGSDPPLRAANDGGGSLSLAGPRLKAGASPQLEALVARALALHRQDRFGNADQMLKALLDLPSPWISEHTEHTEPESSANDAIPLASNAPAAEGEITELAIIDDEPAAPSRHNTPPPIPPPKPERGLVLKVIAAALLGALLAGGGVAFWLMRRAPAAAAKIDGDKAGEHSDARSKNRAAEKAVDHGGKAHGVEPLVKVEGDQHEAHGDKSGEAQGDKAGADKHDIRGDKAAGDGQDTRGDKAAGAAHADNGAADKQDAHGDKTTADAHAEQHDIHGDKTTPDDHVEHAAADKRDAHGEKSSADARANNAAADKHDTRSDKAAADPHAEHAAADKHERGDNTTADPHTDKRDAHGDKTTADDHTGKHDAHGDKTTPDARANNAADGKTDAHGDKPATVDPRVNNAADQHDTPSDKPTAAAHGDNTSPDNTQPGKHDPHAADREQHESPEATHAPPTDHAPAAHGGEQAAADPADDSPHTEPAQPPAPAKPAPPIGGVRHVKPIASELRVLLELAQHPKKARAKAKDPWDGATPTALESLRGAIAEGERGTSHQIAALRHYNGANPDDVHGHLLLAGLYKNRGWSADALDEYDMAYQIDSSARGAPEMLAHAIGMVVHDEAVDDATRFIQRAYQREALPAIDRALREPGLDAKASARLKKLRARVQSGR